MKWIYRAASSAKNSPFAPFFFPRFADLKPNPNSSHRPNYRDIMGNFDSGRSQSKRRVEDTPKIEALAYCRANGLPIFAREMPDGQRFEIGSCAACQQPRRDLYNVENVVKCRSCHSLIYTRDSQSHSAAAAIKKADPVRATGEALEAMSDYVETGEPSKYNQGMKTLCALDRLPDANSATDALTPELAKRILADDLNGSTGLLEIIKAQILEGVENTTNRRGEPLEIAMRGDTLAKLSRAYVTVAAFRATRAGQMLESLEADDNGPTSDDRMAAYYEATDQRTPSGLRMADLHARYRHSLKEGAADD